MQPGAIFEDFMAATDAPVLIVTVGSGENRAGCLIGFYCQTSIDPPRLLVCLSENNRTYRVAALSADHLAVHLVPPDRRDLAELFGGETGDDLDKFEQCSWHDGPHDLPILDDCPDWIAGRILERRPLGDHVGFLLEPVAGGFSGAGVLRIEKVVDIEAGHDA